ncbi:MAG: sugar ABC transporter permease [Cyanobacteria bacterium NC_groundwater_1444_Ag_S-0.65um_54_12]|nr:sugar ABC transporter permease [Cyanobacteria bacterium NC_groundwater_1444_Ag_S-0.65um_54_12]
MAAGKAAFAVPVSTPGPKRHPLAGEARWAWLLLLPALLIIGLFSLLPTLGSFAISFTSWDLLGPPRWIGLANYTALLADPLFYKVVLNTLEFVALYVIIDIVCALGLALALNQQLRGIGLFRTAYFLPVVTSMVAVSIVWEWIYDPRYGALNVILGWCHLPAIHWLSDPHWALPSLVIVSVWKSLGYNVVLFLAGLQAIPTEYHEAAAVDGATGWLRFFRITLPLLGPTLLLVGILSTIRAFQTFDAVYMLTHGGPRRATTVVVYWLFQNAFTYFKLGKASALAYLLFTVLLFLTWLQWTLRKRWIHQEQVS